MNQRVWINAFFSWLVFVGIDFIFHAALLQSLWKEVVPAIKPETELAILIPAGYGSFYLLCLLITYTFDKSFPESPERKELVRFAFIWSLLFSVSNFLGMYSYLEIPLNHLIAFNLVYLVEIFVVIMILNKLYFSTDKRKVRWYCFGSLMILLVLGVVIQNLITNFNA